MLKGRCPMPWFRCSNTSCVARPHINVLTKCDLLPPGVRTLREGGTGCTGQSLDLPIKENGTSPQVINKIPSISGLP